MASLIGATIVVTFALLVSVCNAGEYCYSGSFYTTYCMYGCCGVGNTECCSSSIGLIIGLCVGGAVFLFFIILTICLCRRRHYGGFIYRSQPAVVVQQSNTMTSQQGVVNTAGVQPGVVYPPYQQYQYPGTSYPAGPTSPPAYSAAAYPPAYPPQHGYPPQPGYPPQHYGAEPPKYDTVDSGADGGITNRGFHDKN